MSTLQVEVKARLTGDSSLSALLTGGVFNADDLGQEGMSMSNAPKESNGVTLKPFAVLRWSDANTFGPFSVTAESGYLEIYIYQNVGQTAIEQAVTHVKRVLHDVFVTASDRSLAHFIFTFVSRQMTADELGNAPFRFMRFQNIYIRK